MKGLELPTSIALNIVRTHQPLATKPLTKVQPRSLMVKFSSFKMKEVLKVVWQRKGFDFQGRGDIWTTITQRSC